MEQNRITFLLMQGLSGTQLWYEINFLFCEALVNLGITKCKISSQYGPETIHFFRRWGWGMDVQHNSVKKNNRANN